MNIDLLRLWSGSNKTIVFVTHNILEAVFLSDRIAVMTPTSRTRRQNHHIHTPPATRNLPHENRPNFRTSPSKFANSSASTSRPPPHRPSSTSDLPPIAQPRPIWKTALRPIPLAIVPHDRDPLHPLRPLVAVRSRHRHPQRKPERRLVLPIHGVHQHGPRLAQILQRTTRVIPIHTPKTHARRAPASGPTASNTSATNTPRIIVLLRNPLTQSIRTATSCDGNAANSAKRHRCGRATRPIHRQRKRRQIDIPAHPQNDSVPISSCRVSANCHSTPNHRFSHPNHRNKPPPPPPDAMGTAAQ